MDLTKITEFNIVKNGLVKFESNRLTIDDSVTFEDWFQLGNFLIRSHDGIQFLIGDWAKFGDSRGYYTDPKVYDRLEEITGYSRETIKDFKYVAENVSSRRRDDLPYGHHREVAPLPDEQQEYYLNKAAKENLSVRDLREEVRKYYVEANHPHDLPRTKKYRIIYADPPWKYGNSMPSYFGEQANHYPLMSIEEICQMSIYEICESNAVLFLWVTSPILRESFEVVDAWGFEYKTSFVWDKIKHNMGHYNSVRHEFLLLCTRGSCMPDVAKLHDSVQSIERGQHSEKPEAFRQIIDEIYTEGNRIELFSRRKVEGWDAYGNQLGIAV